MKTLIALIFLCLTGIGSYAQDTLLLKTGNELYVKVEKLDASTVSYRQQGTDTILHTLQKSEIFMIKFSLGTKYVMESTTQPVIIDKAALEKEAREQAAQYDYNKWRSIYNKRKTTGIILLSVGGTILCTGVTLIGVGTAQMKKEAAFGKQYEDMYDREYTGNKGLAPFIVGTILTAASITPCLIGTINLALTAKYKRKMNEAKQQLGFYPSVQPGNAITGTQTGLAMRLTF